MLTTRVTRGMQPRIEAMGPRVTPVERRRRPSRSPARRAPAMSLGSQEEYGGEAAPFVTPKPVPIGIATATPVYLPREVAVAHKLDVFDVLQMAACIIFASIVIFALIGSSGFPEISRPRIGLPAQTADYVPIQHRGPLTWAWMLLKSAVEW